MLYYIYMNQATIDRLKANPHYKARPEQLIPDGYERPKPKEDEPIKTFGVIPKQNTQSIPIHPTQPTKKTNKKGIAK